MENEKDNVRFAQSIISWLNIQTNLRGILIIIVKKVKLLILKKVVEMKKTFLLFLVAVLSISIVALFSLMGCNEEAAPEVVTETVVETVTETVTETVEVVKEHIRIGFSLPQSINVIFTQSGQIMEELGLKDGVEVIIQYANDDTSLQASQIENMITQGIDALIVCSVDMDSIKSSVDAAKAENIPVVCFTRSANNCDVDYMVRMSYYSVGYEAAKLAQELYPEGNYALINGDNGDEVAHIKRQGAVDYLEPFTEDGSIVIVTDQWTKGWKVEEALKLAENALTANNNDIKAFVCANDSTALGTLQAVEAQGLAGEVYINGEDCDIANAQAIVEGKITTSFFAPIDIRVQKSYEIALALIRGETLPEPDTMVDNGFKEVPTIEVSAIAITKDNIYEKIIKIGFHKIEDVYKNIPEDEWPTG